MKPLFWIGVVALILGVASLAVPIPHNEKEGISVGGLSVDVETRHSKKVSPALSAGMILGGLGAIVAGKLKRS